MPNYGLLSGIAQGLKEGLITYRDEKRYQDEKSLKDEDRQLKKKQLAADLFEKGLMEQPKVQSERSIDQLTGSDVVPPPETQGLLSKGNGVTAPEGLMLIPGYKSKEDKAIAKELAVYRAKKKIDAEEEAKAAQGGGNKKAAYTKLPAEVKNKVGIIADAVNGLDEYRRAFAGGDRQRIVDPSTPFLGGLTTSQPIDISRDALVEAIGRLESGGAIGKDEVKSFMRMIPTAVDGDKQAIMKLKRLEQMFNNRLKAFGVDSLEEAGLERNPFVGDLSEVEAVDKKPLISFGNPQKEGDESRNFPMSDIGLLGAVAAAPQMLAGIPMAARAMGPIAANAGRGLLRGASKFGRVGAGVAAGLLGSRALRKD